MRRPSCDAAWHVWENRFFSCPLDANHLGRALAYVERNPVRAGLCREAWQWRWSSAAAHCGTDDLSGLLDLAAWRREVDPAKWRGTLRQHEESLLVQSLRLATSRGRPLGSDRFIAKLETLLGRRLRALPRGRPRKADPTEDATQE
jgi:putative transposase